MTPTLLLRQLTDAGVIVTVVDAELRFRARPGAYKDDLRVAVDDHRQELVAWLTAEDLGPVPTDTRPRVLWLATLARRAGYDAEALMMLIDELFGYRSTGPFELTMSETNVIAKALRASIGVRPAIASATVVSDMPIDDAIPESIARKISIGMTDAVFSRICQRVLGHVGLRDADDDTRVLATLERLGGGQSQ